MRFIDTHAHMYSEQFSEDQDKAMDRAFLSGIDRILLPNVDMESVDALHDLCKRYPKNCFPMMGLHPCSVKEDFKEQLASLKALLFSQEYIAVGEIGIDLHWDKATLAWQQEAFRTQIAWAKEKDLPIVIHARESFQEIFDILDEINDNSLRGVFHCFNGDVDQAKHIQSYGGFMMGIGGVLTYKNSGLKETLAQIPIEKIILETDAPYLAPVPFRGKRNESSYLIEVAIEMSKIYDIPLVAIAEITSSNAIDLFRLNV
jgi:TatD DNase family protein